MLVVIDLPPMPGVQPDPAVAGPGGTFSAPPAPPPPTAHTSGLPAKTTVGASIKIAPPLPPPPLPLDPVMKISPMPPPPPSL